MQYTYNIKKQNIWFNINQFLPLFEINKANVCALHYIFIYPLKFANLAICKLIIFVVFQLLHCIVQYCFNYNNIVPNAV